jgi:molybdate transport system substrate-binding protein
LPAHGESITVYAAAVVKTPLTQIAAEYEKASGNSVKATFDTAGASTQKYIADPAASLLITTTAQVEDAVRSGRLKSGARTPLATTIAGIAVAPGVIKPDLSTRERLRAALLNARRIAFSDPARGATVGLHFMKVIESLGIKDAVMNKAVIAVDGPETMRLVLEGKADLGITQISEIVQASREAVAGPFPQEFELSTEYSLWLPEAASPAVRELVRQISSSMGRKIMEEGGLRPVQ